MVECFFQVLLFLHPGTIGHYLCTHFIIGSPYSEFLLFGSLDGQTERGALLTGLEKILSLTVCIYVTYFEVSSWVLTSIFVIFVVLLSVFYDTS